MNAPFSKPAEVSAFIATQWGVPDEFITPALMQNAHLAVDTKQRRMGEIIVRSGLATQDEIDRHLAQKPSNVLTLNYLFEHINGLRAQSQRLLADSDHIAFYDTLSPRELHPSFSSNAGLHRLCEDNMMAPLVSTKHDRIRIVFSNYETFKNYLQLSRLERANNALGRLTTESNEPITPIWAIGNRDQIALLLQTIHIADSPALEDDDPLNIWHDTNTYPSADTTSQKILSTILSTAATLKVSNIQFMPDDNGTVKVFYRLHGNLIPVPHFRPLPPLQADEIGRFLHVKSHARYNDTGRRVEGRLLSPADGQFIYQSPSTETFLRCSFIPVSNHGIGQTLESISLRLLPRNTVCIELADYNVNSRVISAICDHITQPNGLILLVGPTSSGKSTTIAGTLNEHIKMFGDSKHRLSLEHPVERQLRGITQINVHKAHFELYMAAVLRHDPDTLWVGEIRDRATAATCIRSANTGHLVFSTIHANDAPSAYGALLAYTRNPIGTSAESVMVTEHDTVDALSLIIAQRLVPEICPRCRIPLTDKPELLSRIGLKYQRYCKSHGITPKKFSTPLFTAHPSGCEHCHNGYVSEIPINEILSVDHSLRKSLRNNVNNGKHDLDEMEKRRPYTLHDDAVRLAVDGRIAFADTML